MLQADGCTWRLRSSGRQPASSAATGPVETPNGHSLLRQWVCQVGSIKASPSQPGPPSRLGFNSRNSSGGAVKTVVHRHLQAARLLQGCAQTCCIRAALQMSGDMAVALGTRKILSPSAVSIAPEGRAVPQDQLQRGLLLWPHGRLQRLLSCADGCGRRPHVAVPAELPVLPEKTDRSRTSHAARPQAPQRQPLGR